MGVLRVNATANTEVILESDDTVLSEKIINVNINIDNKTDELSLIMGYFSYNREDFKILSVQSIKDNWFVDWVEYDPGRILIYTGPNKEDNVFIGKEAVITVVLKAIATTIPKASTVRYHDLYCYYDDANNPVECNPSSKQINILPLYIANNTKLSKLEIEGIDIKFNKNQNKYTISTSSPLDNLILDVQTEDENANYNILVEENKIVIIVTAVSGDIEIYEIINEPTNPLNGLLIITLLIIILGFIVSLFIYIKKKKLK